MWLTDGEPLTWDVPGVAVGWLERGHSYTVGKTPSPVTNRIAEMLQPFVGGSGAFGSHHCNLASCGVRLRASSLLNRASGLLAEPLAARMQRNEINLAEQQTILRRTLARHKRKHPDFPTPCASDERQRGETLRSRSKLWDAYVVDGLSAAVRFALATATSLIDPHPYQERWGSVNIRVGCVNLFIPGQSAVYIVPSMILHYILNHDYSPPEEFSDAVLKCPPIGSRTYFEALAPSFPHLSTTDFETWIESQIEFVGWIRSQRGHPEWQNQF